MFTYFSDILIESSITMTHWYFKPTTDRENSSSSSSFANLLSLNSVGYYNTASETTMLTHFSRLFCSMPVSSFRTHLSLSSISVPLFFPSKSSSVYFFYSFLPSLPHASFSQNFQALHFVKFCLISNSLQKFYLAGA